MVTFPDSTRWISNFYTSKCIESMRKDYAKSGACLSGAYWCASSPVIIVDNISRERIEQVIDELIDQNTFQAVFQYFGPVEERELEAGRYPPDFFNKNSEIDPRYVSWHAVQLQQMLEQASEEVKAKIKKEIFD
ncbi:hypothetical protein D3C78_1599630 [compost metagenome]